MTRPETFPGRHQMEHLSNLAWPHSGVCGGPLLSGATGSNGSIRLLRSLDQLTFAQFFAPPGIADLRMAACEISSPRARR
jgi:hypothetical protein